jgi:hypothetical protein
VIALALCLVASAAAAQAAVSAPVLTAAFVYNFVKFAVWPAEAIANGPLTICVIGDTAVADALDTTVRGRRIDGRDILIVRAKLDALHACHLLYLTGLDAARSDQIINELRNAPVLTISDRDRFAESGGVAGLFARGGRMRFAVNVAAAERAHLHISSKLLSLATLVKDEYGNP